MKNKLGLLVVLAFCLQCEQGKKAGIRFSISFSREMAAEAQDGRLLLMLSNNDKDEPRNQINDGLKTQLVFGLDVNGMEPGQEIIIDETAFGFPLRSLS